MTARTQLVDSARELFANEGVDATSLRQVARDADQRNTNAVQYHFGDRETLLAAVLEPHQELVAARRDALLEPLAKQPEPPLRALAEALVRPSAAMLEDHDGRLYLRVMAELIDDPDHLRLVGDAGLGAWRTIAARLLPDEANPLHRRYAAIHLCFLELARRARGRRRSDHRLFVSNLVDLVSAVLDAPVSPETHDLLVERDQ